MAKEIKEFVVVVADLMRATDECQVAVARLFAEESRPARPYLSPAVEGPRSGNITENKRRERREIREERYRPKEQVEEKER